MFQRGSVKRVFPGNNTPDGFFSYYDHILPEDARRLFVIKGGPGVGKSTFMTSIAREMSDRGYDVEVHHCSADNTAVDGVVFPEIGVGLLDGTWPHVVDPRVPGAVDEIIWLGEFWHEESVRASKPEILECQKGIQSVFKRAYRYLKAAQIVYEDWESANVEAMDFGTANIIADRVIAGNLGGMPVAKKPGKDRRLFASAITSDGMVNYLNTIVAPCTTRYVIQGAPGTGKSVLLQKVKDAAMERGLFVEAYYCPLHPQKVEHLLVPGLSLVLTKSIHPHTYVPGPRDIILDMDECRDASVVESHRQYAELAENQFNSLFGAAIGYIGQARKYHDALERFYAPNMDFAGIDRLRKKTMERILGYAEEAGEGPAAGL